MAATRSSTLLPKLNPKANKSDPFEISGRSIAPTIFPLSKSPDNVSKSLTIPIKDSLKISINNSDTELSVGILETTLPEGWSRLQDSKTGMPYYSNHWTQTTTWTDPRTILPIPIQFYSWIALPVGWEVLTDVSTGKRYFLNHDTQTTSWSSPYDNRTRKLVSKLYHYYTQIETQVTELKENIKVQYSN